MFLNFAFVLFEDLEISVFICNPFESLNRWDLIHLACLICFKRNSVTGVILCVPKNGLQRLFFFTCISLFWFLDKVNSSHSLLVEFIMTQLHKGEHEDINLNNLKRWFEYQRLKLVVFLSKIYGGWGHRANSENTCSKHHFCTFTHHRKKSKRKAKWLLQEKTKSAIWQLFEHLSLCL